MPGEDLGGNVLVAVGPLIQVAGRAHANGADVDASDLGDKILRQAKWSLGIGGQFVPAPARRVDTSFVQEGGREGVVPDQREGIVHLRVMIYVIAIGAVIVS